MSRVRVGLVGCGTIAQVMHLPGLAVMREMGKVEIVSVCDAVAEKAAAAAAQYAVPHHFDNLDAMLGSVEIDLLVNNTPIPQHFAVSTAALRAGRHVYTQKPMTSTLFEANTLVEEARARGLALGCAPEHPVRSLIRTIRDLIDGGAIGKVTFARVQSSHDGPEKHDVPRDSTWYYKPGSSPILDMGIHGLSTITAIIGPVRRLTCFSGRSRPERMTTAGPFKGKRIEVEIDDNSLLMLDFGEARYALLDATYCVPASRGPQLEIHGEDGTLAVSGGKTPVLELYETARQTWRTIEVPPDPPLRDLGVLHMVDHLRDGIDLVLTGDHGRHLVEVLTAAPRAAAEGRTLAMETTF